MRLVSRLRSEERRGRATVRIPELRVLRKETLVRIEIMETLWRRERG
jgi:hypothetical protein